MSRRLSVHDVITINEEEWQILALNHPQDQATCFCAKTQESSTLSIRSLHKQLAKGEATSNAPAASKGLMQNFNLQSPKGKKFLKNVEIVNAIRKLTSAGETCRNAILMTKETGIKLPTGETVPMCSERDAYRLLKDSRDHMIGLMPNYDNRGNSTRRYPLRVDELLLEAIRDKYAVTKSQITISFLVEAATLKARAEGIHLTYGKVSRKYVKSFVINNWNPDLDYNRLEPRIAKSAKAIAKHCIKPGGPLDRVEIDTVHLPFKVKLDGKTINDIWVMIAIDCGTSVPLSWWTMTAKPTTDDTFSCLQRAIYPKEELFAELGIQSTIDPSGSIMNLFMDNGQENSKDRMPALTALNINLHWTEKSRGDKKPFIERFNRSLKEGLESLPGSTRVDGKDGERAVEDMQEDLMELAELDRWIGRFCFEFSIHRPLDRFVTPDYQLDKGLGLTPAERWKRYEELGCMSMCPNIEDWRRVKFLSATGRLSAKTGISFKTFMFRGSNLEHLIHQYGPDAVVQYHYDPHDFRSVYVDDKTSKNWLQLINTKADKSTPAFSFDYAVRREKEVRSTHVPSPIAEKFRHDRVERSMGSSKKQAKEAARKETYDDTRTRQAYSRRNSNPLPDDAAAFPAFDSFVSRSAITTFVKHKKSDWAAK